MQFEAIRIGISLACLLLATYYDLFNRRNVPVQLTYLMLAAGFLLNLATLDFNGIIYPAAAALAILAVGYLAYRTGQIGGADILIFAALALLLPEAPKSLLSLSSAKLPLSYPFIISIFVLSGLFSIIGISLTYLPRVFAAVRKGKVKVSGSSAFSSAAILFCYALVLYMLNTAFGLPAPQMVAVAALVLLTALLILFKDGISESMIEWIPFSRIDNEDVIALDKLDPKLVEKYSLQKVLTPPELAKLKKTGLKKFPIFTGMPPFVPYILLALIFLLIFGDPILLLLA